MVAQRGGAGGAWQDGNEELLAQARAEGFAAARVTRPDAIPEAAARLAAFVAEGRHGDMGWMAERMGWRGDPAALWPDARSVVMLAEVYAPGHDPLADAGAARGGGDLGLRAEPRLP